MNTENLTELIKKAKEYDRVDLTNLCKMFYDKIFNYIYYKVRNTADAEDLTSEVFIKMTEENLVKDALFIKEYIKNAITNLTEEHEDVIILRFVEGHKISKIAAFIITFVLDILQIILYSYIFENGKIGTKLQNSIIKFLPDKQKIKNSDFTISIQRLGYIRILILSALPI